MIDKYGYSETAASEIVTMQYMITAILLPILGAMVDRTGNIIWYVIAGGILRLSANIIQIMIPDCDNACSISMLPYIIDGVSYAIFMGIYFTCIAYLVEPKLQSTAYGINSCFLNTGITILPPFVGLIHDKTPNIGQGYFWVYVLFILLSVISLSLKITLKFWD